MARKIRKEKHVIIHFEKMVLYYHLANERSLCIKKSSNDLRCHIVDSYAKDKRMMRVTVDVEFPFDLR